MWLIITLLSPWDSMVARLFPRFILDNSVPTKAPLSRGLAMFFAFLPGPVHGNWRNNVMLQHPSKGVTLPIRLLGPQRRRAKQSCIPIHLLWTSRNTLFMLIFQEWMRSTNTPCQHQEICFSAVINKNCLFQWGLIFSAGIWSVRYISWTLDNMMLSTICFLRALLLSNSFNWIILAQLSCHLPCGGKRCAPNLMTQM